MKRTSTVKIRKIWTNTNSDKDQVSVQFSQEMEGSTASNPLINAAQGTSFGPTYPTTILSFKAEKAMEYFGTADVDYSDVEFADRPGVESFEEAVGGPVAISIVENTERDPNRPNQEPKLNPQTGEVLLYDGSPIYRHTELTLAADAKTILLKHNDTAPAEAFATADVVAKDAFAVAGATKD